MELFETSVRASTIDLHIGHCCEVVETLADRGIMFDAIICDPPYEIGYMAKAWDGTGIAFQPATWVTLTKVLKPGGYLVAFSGARLYHHLAHAIEQAELETYPFLIWSYPSGLPKPMNVGKLMDRDNCPDREPITYKKGSGYNAAQLKHGQQNYSKLEFPVYDGLESDEALRWDGYYYGVNTMKPRFDPIYLGRKPISEPRVIDNLRRWGTGALNVDRLHWLRGGEYPSTIFHCPKANIRDHRSDHPTVKPDKLMRELLALCCPQDGHILDPFAGTGSTGVAARELGFDCTLIELDESMRSEIERRCALIPSNE